MASKGLGTGTLASALQTHGRGLGTVDGSRFYSNYSVYKARYHATHHGGSNNQASLRAQHQCHVLPTTPMFCSRSGQSLPRVSGRAAR
ncbi:hypothetical protein L211DRAFT_835196 [Terfezia boudieri ATCC MYA-4762]|uniref:Uncharacterized protein n=1 Tax=Terfezia boudieri ATCC MYA-4762 TaxID=1051890 RepID=A0A3N4LVN5_9PEZI|nr:hypothetical protein L211DRAFT_835196 [Terfezia boudieri ATCC MYA-4762]